MTDINNLSDSDIMWMFLGDGENTLRANGYGDRLDAMITAGNWNPLDMSNVPPTPPASALNEHGQRFTIAIPTQGDPPEEEDLPPYEEWSHQELVEESKVRGLSTDGSVDDLAFRLLEYDAREDAGQLPSGDGENGPNGGSEDDDEYNPHRYDAWTRDDLVKECKTRGLATVGKKEELIGRLLKDDAEKSTPTE